MLLFTFIGTQTDGTTLFVNACSCTLQYRPTNRPIVIDLPLDKSLPPVVVDWLGSDSAEL